MENGTRRAAAAVLVVAGILASLGGVAAAPREPSLGEAAMPTIVDRESVAVGDVIAHGTPDGAGCAFAPVGVRAPATGTPVWTAVQVDSLCVARVSAKWEGPLESGPADIVGAVAPLGVLPASQPTPPVPAVGGVPLEGMSPNACTSRTSSQHVFSYGAGGTSDSLTHETSSITYCYTGSVATITAYNTLCQGQYEGLWAWVVDGCFYDTIATGPAGIVDVYSHGNYHCTPPLLAPCFFGNGYYHSLYDYMIAGGDGSSSCTYTWTGTVVSGVTHQILQGCT